MTNQDTEDVLAVIKDYEANPLTVVERYYTQFYWKDEGVGFRRSSTQYVNQHSNILLVIGIAPTHQIIQESKKIVRVDFEGTKKQLTKIEGKRKKGGLWVEINSPICRVVCQDDDDFIIYSGVRGHLIEINTKLESSPELLIDKPATEGYIGIIKPKFQDQEAVAHLLSKEAYLAALGQN